MRFARWLLAGLVLLAGCSLIIDGDVVVVHCEEEGAVGPPACPEGFGCRDGLCVMGAVPLGSPCADDGDCVGADLCLDAASVGFPPAMECSRTCCTSNDCDEGFACAPAPLGGGSFCRAVDASGAGAAGSPCGGPGDCRSGVCDATHRCLDTCCSETSCVGLTCRFDGRRPGLACLDPVPSGRALYQACDDDAQCASSLCVVFPDSVKRCALPCCSSVECPVDDDGDTVACVEVVHPPRGGGVDGDVLVRACAKTWTGSGLVGARCTNETNCRSAQCVGATGGDGTCTDVCCTDADCGDPATFVCRPVAREPGPGPASTLRCELK